MAASANEYKLQLKSRFKKGGLSSLTQREVLDLVLFYSMPANNVKECADSLLQRFHSLDCIFNASISSLCEVPKMTEKAAAFIKLIPEMCSQYAKSSYKNKRISCMSEIKDFFTTQYYGVKKEVVIIAFLDKNFNVIHVRTVKSGDPSSVMISIRTLISEVITSGCTGCVMSYNHPHGSCIPSQNDLALTKSIQSMLQTLNVRLYDHVIIASDGVWSIKTEGKI